MSLFKESNKKGLQLVLDDKKNEKKNNTLFKEYLSTCPDVMKYDDSIKKDDRTFSEYLKEIIEQTQSFSFSFIASDPVQPRTIKIILFCLNIILYFVINGLLFNEDYISELYHLNEKDENFFSFIFRSSVRIFYATIVALFIGYLIDFFFLEEEKVKGIFKREKDNRNILKKRVVMFINEVQNRYLSFIIVVFIILFMAFYYFLCFNYVYPKSQIEWLKSSILIFIIMQILSIIRCLLQTILRFASFKCESEILYKVSVFLGEL